MMIKEIGLPLSCRQNGKRYRYYVDGELDYVLQECPLCGQSKTFRITLISNESKSGYDKDACTATGASVVS
jgi:predicted RNA-binding Zn-ribbon protein involved in translation (DUF1610 family)